MKEFSATTGQALDDDATGKHALQVESDDQTMRTLPLALIVPSRTNPRQHFDPKRLHELADSIKASGVHQPILVRPLPGDRIEETSHPQNAASKAWDSAFPKPKTARPTHELVAGERRYRASLLAGKTSIPALIRALTDEQVLEIQIVENLQRDDLTELEEAEGYERLMAHSTLTAEAVGAKIGKSRSYVYARLKLLDLCTEARQALREGKIDASRGLLIARIPDGKLQGKALAEATRQGGYLDEVPSVRELQTWLQRNVMLRLENAPFQITDAQLCPDAGSCKSCPKRTGANPDLFADVDGADICTDPPCYQAKEAAHRARLVAKAEAKGMRVIEGKEAREIFPTQGTSIMHGYVRLDQKRKDIDDTAPTLRALLGKDAPSPVMIEHPVTRELIEAVPTDEAEALLLTKGLIRASKAQEEAESEITYLQESIKAKTLKAKRAAKYRAVIDAIRATPDKKAPQLITASVMRAWFETVLGDYIDTDDMAAMFGMTIDPALDATDAVAMHVRACGNADLHRALATFMTMEDRPNWGGNDNQPLVLDALADGIGVDTTAAEKDAVAAIKAEVAAEIKKLKADAAPKIAKKAPLANDPAAPPADGPGGGKPKKSAASTVPARKLKTTPEEAMQGIAVAMQNMDAEPVGGGVDPLFESAVALIVREQKATVRLIKTELSIGTSKALELMSALEDAGKVSTCDERGARKVLVAA